MTGHAKIRLGQRQPIGSGSVVLLKPGDNMFVLLLLGRRRYKYLACTFYT